MTQRPTLLSVETKIAHASKKSKNAETLIKTVQKDREARADVLAKYEKDLKEVRKLVAKHQGLLFGPIFVYQLIRKQRREGKLAKRKVWF